MSNLLWILVLGNVGYLLFALSKAKRSRHKAQEVLSLADETRILTVPDHMLNIQAVGKTVNLKEAPAEAQTSENPWEQKIVRPEHRMGFRKGHDHNQLLLQDIDSNLK
jgi:hypothetical protein